MTLIFPNRSRSFDEARKVVRFLGYDGMFEVRFFVEAKALADSTATGMSEADYLRAFDAARSSIQDAAMKAYRPSRGTTYTLTAADLG
ncbi:hypothetical protein J2T08_000790 [Neorhizobium galegae]|uniref:DUF1488 domain-containing protein n=1 Tax=Neorhizobium galegae TaxID=399 RepID=UPI001AE933EF|nr:DUF1488 domain-containing protein [Neorhizobium galegae]MBP2560049.1 hypothetical protein [Neorhizobium galegae]MDQ0132889.1 hypothetical protein [Neorhizobium galegae]